jgi:hypothetical protein
MYYQRAPEMNSEERGGAKRAVVESAEALVVSATEEKTQTTTSLAWSYAEVAFGHDHQAPEGSQVRGF